MFNSLADKLVPSNPKDLEKIKTLTKELKDQMDANKKCKIKIIQLVRLNKKLKDGLEELGKLDMIVNMENQTGTGRGDSSDALRNLSILDLDIKYNETLEQLTQKSLESAEKLHSMSLEQRHRSTLDMKN